MTGGLGNVDTPPFEGGPLGDIGGILDKFDLDFSGLVDDFLDYYRELANATLSLETNILDLVELKPLSLSNFPDLSSLGSKKPATQYSPKFKEKVWNKLVLKFPSAFYNGVRIPGLEPGKSLAESFSAKDFPSESM